jgi:hypothetical protein
LVKERTLNTEQLLNQNNKLKEELAVEKKAKRKAESALTKMQKRVGKLEDHVGQLQSQMTLLLQQQQLGGGGGGGGRPDASGSGHVLNAVTRAEMAALQIQVARHDKQLAIWNKAMKEVQQPQSGGGGGGISRKRAAGGGYATATGEDDPVRARAVAMRQAKTLGKAAEQQQEQQQRQQRQRQQLPPTKRVRLNEEPLVGGSAGGSEAAPPGFADVAIDALRAVMGADADQQPPSSAAVHEAVKILGPLDNSNNSSQKRNIVAAFECAVLECAAAAPARRFAAPSLSPRHWFEAAAGSSGSRKASMNSKYRKSSAAIMENISFLPSFSGVWCSSEVLQRHSLPWLLHCAVEISAAAASAKEEEEENALENQNLCQILAKDLALLVIKDLATSSPRPLLHSQTELCAAASAAAALWRSQGDSRSFQAFMLDILLSKVGNNEFGVLAPLAAAIESWLEALPQNKGALGNSIHGLLQHACILGKGSPLLEVRVAATWLRKVGVQECEWNEELSEEEAEEVVREARRQLTKFAPSSAVAVITEII